MSYSINRVELLGNIGKDAETRYTPGGKSVSNFSVATSWRKKDQYGEYQDDTTWHNVVVWDSEKVAPLLTRGKKVFIEGRIQNRSFDGNDGTKRYITEVVASNVIVLDRGEKGDVLREELGKALDTDAPF